MSIDLTKESEVGIRRTKGVNIRIEGGFIGPVKSVIRHGDGTATCVYADGHVATGTIIYRRGS